jgi:hypothetical protein
MKNATIAEQKWNTETVTPSLLNLFMKDIRENRLSLWCIPSGNQLYFVCDNALQLKATGLLEGTLLEAFTSSRINNRHISICWIDYLFSLCDRSVLRSLSEPLPGGGCFKIYRGVAGSKKSRRVMGWSWTTDLHVACWFSLRLGLKDPAVYEATIDENNIFAYVNDRNESEVICCPSSRPKNLRLTPEELQVFADVFQSRKRSCIKESSYA